MDYTVHTLKVVDLYDALGAVQDDGTLHPAYHVLVSSYINVNYGEALYTLISAGVARRCLDMYSMVDRERWSFIQEWIAKLNKVIDEQGLDILFNLE